MSPLDYWWYTHVPGYPDNVYQITPENKDKLLYCLKYNFEEFSEKYGFKNQLYLIKILEGYGGQT